MVPSGKVDELFIINRAVDAIFIFDMGLQFFLMYPQAPTSPTDTVRWIHEPNKITKHYLKGWFTLDFVSIAISAIDYLTLDVFTGGEESDLSNMKIFRVIRVARLVKLVRLVKSSRIMKRLESRMAINYGHLALFKCMVGIIIAAHWYACVWGLITGFETMDQTWYVNCGYCEFDPKDGGVVAAAALANPNNASLQEEYTKQLEDEREYACQGPYERYMAALYWAIMTITSIGYGDIAATPQNAYEQAWCAFLMLLGGMIWGAVIATFCGVIANLDPGGTEFRKTMDELNSFARPSHTSIVQLMLACCSRMDGGRGARDELCSPMAAPSHARTRPPRSQRRPRATPPATPPPTWPRRAARGAGSWRSRASISRCA